LEATRDELLEKAARRARRRTWGVLGFVGLQFGFLARLTWWEYSWDIIEPVTYFINLAGQLIVITYFITTQQEYGQ